MGRVVTHSVSHARLESQVSGLFGFQFERSDFSSEPIAICVFPDILGCVLDHEHRSIVPNRADDYQRTGRTAPCGWGIGCRGNTCGFVPRPAPVRGGHMATRRRRS